MKRALREAQKSSKKPRGGQKQTCLKLITKDVEIIKVKVVLSGGGHFDRKYDITNLHTELIIAKECRAKQT